MILHDIDYAKPTMDPSFEKEWNIQCEVPLIFEVSINHLGVADIVFFCCQTQIPLIRLYRLIWICVSYTV